MATQQEVQDMIGIAVGALQSELQQRDTAIRDLQARLDAQAAASQSAAPVVDTRLIGKPDSYDGGPNWRDWSTVFRSYTAAVSPRLSELMHHAEASLTPALNATISASDRSLSTQLHYMMVMLCKGSALTRVVNAGPSEGLEGWRSLVAHHEPASQVRHASLLMELLSFSFEGDIDARLVLFDREVNRYEKSSNEVFPDNVKIGTLMRQLPEGPLRQHVILNSARLNTWATLKQEVEAVRRAQSSAMSGPAPMDVSAFVQTKGGWKGGKAKGKGKGDKSGLDKVKPTTPCPLCGKMHWKRDCPQNKGKGQQQPNNNGGGKNNNNNAADSGRKCWNCGEKGHMSSSCPKKRSGQAASLQTGGDTASMASTTLLNTTAGSLQGLYLNAFVDSDAPVGHKCVFSVDSGASRSVIGKDVAADYPVVSDDIVGTEYRTATGEVVRDRGVKHLVADIGGKVRVARGRVVPGVAKNLMSVYDMCTSGHRVVFELGEDGSDRSYITHRPTGSQTPMHLRNRVWELDLDVAPYSQIQSVLPSSDVCMQELLCPFQGQGLNP